jgi:hypothetical protein
MSEETKKPEEEGADFLVQPVSDEELEDVSGGAAVAGCSDGSGCCDGFVPTDETS